MRHHRLAWLLVIIAALSLVACGDDDDDAAGTVAAGAFTTISEGTLTVCSDAPYEPFEFEGEDGEFTGFDIDLLRTIATNLDLDLEVTVQPFDGIWLAPEAGTCDIVASAMTITPERTEAALFSEPYFDADQSLLVLAEDAETYADLESLAGETIGVQSGTTGATYAEENAPDATLREFDGGDALFPALASGQVAAVLQDFPVNAYRATQDERFAVTAQFETGEQYGFATRRDDANSAALMEAVDGQLAALREDGTYDEIFETWFGEG